MVNRQALRDYFMEVAPGKADQLMEDLDPFFLHAERGRFFLAPDSDELRTLALTTLQLLFGEGRVKKVVTVSLKNPYPRPEWIDIEVNREYIYRVWDSLQRSIDKSFILSFVERFPRAFAKLNRTLEENLARHFWHSFWESVSVGFEKVRCEDETLEAQFEGNLYDTLSIMLYYPNTVIFDEKRHELGEKMRKTVRLLSWAIPLGQKKSQSGTWILLVA